MHLMIHPWSLTHLPENSLRDKLATLVERDRQATASILACLAEFDRRQLWANEGVSSTFAYCTERLHMSESAACKRIWVARLARKYPVIFSWIAEGRVHLSAIMAVRAYLTDDNHQAVLARIEHKSKRQVQAIVAELAPRPDVRSCVRALPCPRPRVLTHARVEAPKSEAAMLATAPEPATGAPPSLPPRPLPPSPRSVVEPLSPRRYQITITVSEETRTTLSALQDLLAAQIPTGDPAFIVSRALDALLHETLKRKAALTHRPASKSVHVEGSTRAIPAAVRRTVWKRDGGRCAFVDSQGRRCRETRAIEYHHELPFALGGPHSEDNVALRCSAHNQHQANLDFGRAFMDAKRSARLHPD